MKNKNNQLKNSTALTFSFFAVGISLFSLFLSIMSFNRTGANFDKSIEKNIYHFSQELKLSPFRASLISRLTELKNKINDNNLESVGENIMAIKAELYSLYQKNDLSIPQKIKDNLAILENSLSDKQQALDSIENLIAILDQA